MKKILYICMCAMVAGLGVFVVSCTKDPNVESTASQSQDAYLSVEEARTFFEESFTEGQTRSAGETAKSFLDPGEYTPQWEDAVTSQNDALGSVDIPIMAQYKYRAIRSEFKKGKAKAYIVDMPQKLVVVKSKKTKSKAQYVLTLIPDKDYYEKNKNRNIIKRFLNSGDKDEFSGYVLYTLDGFPARLNKYKKGEKIAGVSIIGVTDKATITKRLKTILRELSKIEIQRKEQTVQTRWGEDDDYGWEDAFWDAFDFDIDDFGDGGSIDFGDDGDVYVDYDGDGNIDEKWVYGGDDNTDPDPDPDPWPEDDDEDPWSCDCGCCSECGYCGVCSSCDPPEPDPCECGDCAECGYDIPSVGDNEEQKNVNKEHTPKSTDHLSNNTITKMDRKTQKGNTCVPTILEYILKNKGDDTKRKEIVKYYEERLSKDGEKHKVIRDGVPANEVPSGVVNFLGNESMGLPQYGGDPPYDYKGAIDRGSMVMTNIFLDVDGQTVGHNILVVGYTEDGNYIYIDPNDADNEYECSPDYLNKKNTYKYDFEIKK